MLRRFVSVLPVVLAILAARVSAAQGADMVIRPCAPCMPGANCRTLDCRRPMPPQVVRTSSSVRAELDGRVVRYEVTETYTNHGGMIGEADFLLPLPKGAAFEELALSINGEMVTGETMNAERARGVYEEIVRKLRDPALVEWMGHGLLRARIFPIQPGEEKRVVVRFSAVAEREGDALRLDWLGNHRAGEVGDIGSFTLELCRRRHIGRRIFAHPLAARHTRAAPPHRAHRRCTRPGHDARAGALARLRRLVVAGECAGRRGRVCPHHPRATGTAGARDAARRRAGDRRIRLDVGTEDRAGADGRPAAAPDADAVGSGSG